MRSRVGARTGARRRNVRIVEPCDFRVDAAFAAAANEGSFALLAAAPEVEAGKAKEHEAGGYTRGDADRGCVFGWVGC